jgi:hypothetical protein
MGVMTTTPKILAAREALLSFYADIQQRRLGKKFTAKKRAATIALAEMYEVLRERLRDSGRYEPLTCVCKIDRTVFTTKTLSWKAILGIPGYIAQNPTPLWKRDYRFARRIRGTGSISEIVIESEPTASWFAPFRITIIPRDDTGLRYGDLRLLLELLPGVELKVLEVAWDFPSGCVVDLDYVRRFGLFGSTWIEPGTNPYHDKWGGVGSKVVRAYFKWDTFQFRIELELHVQLLRRLGISDVFDFRKLVVALIPDHIEFSQLDDGKLAHALDLTGLPQHETSTILKRVKQKAQTSLWAARRYLREKAHLDNRQRLLVPVPDMNRVIREALEKLIAQWPAGPARLGKKP